MGNVGYSGSLVLCYYHMKIIVPIDFSPVSLNAANYAANIAKKLNGTLLLLHVYIPVVSGNNQVAALDHELIENERKRTEERLKNLGFNSGKWKDIQSICKTNVGNLADEIDLEARSEADSLIVMGLMDKTFWQDIFGRSAADLVFEKTFYPLLIIPESASTPEIQNILFITDGDPDDLEPAASLSRMAKKLSARFSILRLSMTPSNSADQSQGDISIETINWTGKNRFNRLLEVVRKKQPQLIAYSENQRTALSRFMEGNPIERAAKRMNLPYICFNRTNIKSKGSKINPKFFVAPL